MNTQKIFSWLALFSIFMFILFLFAMTAIHAPDEVTTNQPIIICSFSESLFVVIFFITSLFGLSVILYGCLSWMILMGSDWFPAIYSVVMIAWVALDVPHAPSLSAGHLAMFIGTAPAIATCWKKGMKLF